MINPGDGLSKTIAFNYFTLMQPAAEDISAEAHRLDADTSRISTSENYPFSGVFGSDCSRHDTIYKLTDMSAVEG